VTFSIRTLLLLILIVACGMSGTRWWLHVSQERRKLSEWDPTRNEIFDWAEPRKAIAAPVLDEMRSELMRAAYFDSKERKLAICNRYIDTLLRPYDKHDKYYRPDLGRAFDQLGAILEFSEEDTERLAARLGYDLKNDCRIPFDE
jgi:hypothetical protein